MRVLLFGASGGIGTAVREQAHAAGHELTLFSRDVSNLAPVRDRERAFQGDIQDPSSVTRAIAGADSVISALGPSRNSADQVALFEGFARVLVEQMRASNVRRLVAISGAACMLPGERKPIGGRIASAVVRLAVRHVVKAKQRELEVIVASDLDWILPRPARVVEGPRTGRYRVGPGARGMRISQQDVADFMVKSLADDAWLRQAPLISS